MLSSKPLFPGRDYHHQLTLILDVLGTPTLDEFYAISTRRSRDYIRALPFRKKRSFAQIFPKASSLAVDFLAKTLVSDFWPLRFVLKVGHKLTCAIVIVDFRSEKANYGGGGVGSSLSGSLCTFIVRLTCQRPFLMWLTQHDPEDEPVAPPLDPEFFDFDCTFVYRLFISIRDSSRIITISTQGRY